MMPSFKLSKELIFFIFLLGKYAERENMTPVAAYDQWKNAGLLDYINSMYFMYHQESPERHLRYPSKALNRIEGRSRFR